MLNRKSFVLVLLLIVISFTELFADSPLTSTPFYKAYLDNPMVKEAKINGVMNDNMAKYLFNKGTPIDLKVAVINALGWDNKGKNNANIFKKLLEKKYKFSLDTNTYMDINPEDLFCFGYLKAMDNYFEPLIPFNIINMATSSNYKSFTFNLIFALVKAQIYSDNFNWCHSYLVCEQVRNNHKLKMDMRPEAIKIIFDYLEGGSKYCKESTMLEYLNHMKYRDSLTFEIYELSANNIFLKKKEKDKILPNLVFADIENIENIYKILLEAHEDQKIVLKELVKQNPNMVDSLVVEISSRFLIDNPNDAKTYIERGKAYLNLSNKEKACLDFKKADELGAIEAKELIENNCNK